MTRRLHIDVSLELVTICSGTETRKTFRGQWVEFYALVGLFCVKSESNKILLQPAALCTVGRWMNKSPASAGKELSRHINSLQGSVFDGVLLWTRKTYGWYLNMTPEQITWEPSLEKVTEWLVSRGWREISIYEYDEDVFDISWVRHAVAAIITLHSGKTEEAVNLSLRSKEVANSHFLGKISDLLIFRSSARAGIDFDDDLGSFAAATISSASAIDDALNNRIRAIHAFSTPHGESKDALETLAKLATRMHDNGDICGLGVIYNTMGVLARRAGLADEALMFLQRSIPLLVVGGDLPTLQAAIFNLGHARYSVLKKNELEPDDDVFSLIDLDCEMRGTLKIGKDSAQAEILGANLALKIRDFVKANNYLTRAECLLESISSEYDSACYYRTRAKYRWLVAEAENSGNQEVRSDVKKDLLKALRLFRTAGHSVSKLEKELLNVRSGGPPYVK